ncbi:MAG: zinc-ribbon domain-containing protein [Lawsonibacter sp.]
MRDLLVPLFHRTAAYRCSRHRQRRSPRWKTVPLVSAFFSAPLFMRRNPLSEKVEKTRLPLDSRVNSRCMLMITRSICNGKTRISGEVVEREANMSLHSYCVKYGKEYLLREWDTEKNAPLSPEGVARTSTVRVWWSCEKGHSWQTQISSRAKGTSGCPICLREKIDARMKRHRAVKAEKTQNRHIKSNNGGNEE